MKEQLDNFIQAQATKKGDDFVSFKTEIWPEIFSFPGSVFPPIRSAFFPQDT